MTLTKSWPSGEWNEKYWDIISNLFLTPQYMGWKPISRSKWHIENGLCTGNLSRLGGGFAAVRNRWTGVILCVTLSVYTCS